MSSESPRRFRLALIQMLVAGGEKEANLIRAERRISEAVERGAEVILLPEALTAGWTWPGSEELADEVPQGATCQRLATWARKHNTYLCAGLVERGRAHLQRGGAGRAEWRSGAASSQDQRT